MGLLKAAISSTAASAIATPAALSAVDASFKGIEATATTQITASSNRNSDFNSNLNSLYCLEIRKQKRSETRVTLIKFKRKPPRFEGHLKS